MGVRYYLYLRSTSWGGYLASVMNLKELVLERENILEQDFSTNSINQKWVSDITYIYVQQVGGGI